jgi:lipopolysaccharide transport system ATP-binding protein
MNDIAIRAEGLSKQYHIGKRQARYQYKTLRETMTNAVAAPFRRAFRILQGQATGASDLDQTMWALDDVSFEVRRGEIVGILGNNGAGKSTLLKILSRITEPTKGFAEIKGRMGSLLEVGTGFHPELTGRENIYLNGAIIGMTRRDIDQSFDQIVDFSEVENFIDTPVKHYSSGMYLRLAFAVAAHLEPEILLIDEVLAVGDAAFQKKCLGKMEDITKKGKTVLFVSHNLVAVSSLCPTSIILQNGRMNFRGPTEIAIERYLSQMQDLSQQPLETRKDRDGNGSVRVLDLWLENHDGRRVTSVTCGDNVSIRLSYRTDRSFRALQFIVGVYNSLGVCALSFDTNVNPIQLDCWPTSGTLTCTLSSPFPLSHGIFSIRIAVFAASSLADYVANAARFEVFKGDFFKSGKSFAYWPLFLVENDWTLEKTDA